MFELEAIILYLFWRGNRSGLDSHPSIDQLPGLCHNHVKLLAHIQALIAKGVHHDKGQCPPRRHR